MKRIISFVLLLTVVMCILMFSLAGCKHNLQTTASNQGISLDLLNQFKKEYIVDIDGPFYESFDSYRQSVIQERRLQGAIVKFHCIETTPYITISHQGDDIFVSGKTVVKCKIDTIAETFNNYEMLDNIMVVIEQQYYFEPVLEVEYLKMFEEFGAHFQTNQLGDYIGMSIADGNYVLKHKDNVDYVLKLHTDVLPLCLDQTYYGLLLVENDKETIKFFSPEDDIKMYDSFDISNNYSTIANEIRHCFNQ